MGELIRVLGTIKSSAGDISIEENESTSEIPEMHIQSSKFRIELDQIEFIELSAIILLALENLNSYKGEKI